MKARVRLWLCLAAAGLASCAGVAPVSVDQQKARAAWDARRPQLEHISGFTFQGRASASGALSGSANLIWRQRQANFDLRLSGPFGVGALLLSGTPQHVRIRSKRDDFVTDNPEQTLRESLGWSLPVTHLRWWAVGLPAPDAAAALGFDAAGRLATLAQDGWDLRYEAYRSAQGYELPQRIALSRDDYRIHIVVDAWADLAVNR